MITTYLNATDAKDDLSELINRVSHHQECIILTRRGKEIAALVSIDLLKLLQEKQNQADLEEATESLKEVRKTGSLTLEELKSEH